MGASTLSKDKKELGVIMPKALFAKLKADAQSHYRHVSQHVLMMINAWYEAEDKQRKAAK